MGSVGAGDGREPSFGDGARRGKATKSAKQGAGEVVVCNLLSGTRAGEGPLQWPKAKEEKKTRQTGETLKRARNANGASPGRAPSRLMPRQQSLFWASKAVCYCDRGCGCCCCVVVVVGRCHRHVSQARVWPTGWLAKRETRYLSRWADGWNRVGESQYQGPKPRARYDLTTTLL